MTLTPRKRTFLGLALFVPLAGILLATFACLPAPIGDPNTATIDEKLTGVWEAVPKPNADDDQTTLVTLRPWDQHTWFVQYLAVAKEGKADKNNVINYKGWLAKMADVNFIVLESLDESQFLLPKEQQDAEHTEGHYYWVARLAVKDNVATLRPIDEDSDFVKGLDTREKLEAAITAHVHDDRLYASGADDEMTLKKLSGDDLKKLEGLRKKLNLGFGK